MDMTVNKKRVYRKVDEFNLSDWFIGDTRGSVECLKDFLLTTHNKGWNGLSFHPTDCGIELWGFRMETDDEIMQRVSDGIRGCETIPSFSVDRILSERRDELIERQGQLRDRLTNALQQGEISYSLYVDLIDILL